jgi:hypothetical protein
MFQTSALIVASLVLGCTARAQSIEVGAVNPATHTLTITLKGAIGPILSGSDPLGLDRQTATVKILASESLKPTKHTATSEGGCPHVFLYEFFA